jgi:hypothetical protein
VKKYIVPSDDNKSWKLIASRAVPSHAVCEAPEHWTRQMEPFIDVKVVKIGGQEKTIPFLEEGWDKTSKAEAEKRLEGDLVRMKKVSDALRKAEANRKFNSLNPVQRYLKSLLGDWTTSVTGSFGRTIMIAIFKDKLY